jgi:hypothetical protein
MKNLTANDSKSEVTLLNQLTLLTDDRLYIAVSLRAGRCPSYLTIKNIYSYKDDAARECLTDMPPRLEEELDAVTLHNLALMNMDNKPTEGFEKLQFLLQQVNYLPVVQLSRSSVLNIP